MWNYCGESNIWRFPLKIQLVRFLIGSFLSTVWKETHAYSLNGILLIGNIYAIRQTTKLKPLPNIPRIQNIFKFNEKLSVCACMYICLSIYVHPSDLSVYILLSHY